MSIHKIQAAVEAFAAGEIVVVTDDDDRENEGRPHHRGDALHAGEDGVHRPQHLRDRLRAPDQRRRAAPQARPDGSAERRAAGNRLHRLRRRPPRAHDGHLGRAALQHRPRPRQRQYGSGRLRAARPHLPADRQGWRRAHALRPHGGCGRPLPAGGPAASRRDLRARQRRRHREARPRGGRVRRKARPPPRLHRRPHRLPSGAREARGEDRDLHDRQRDRPARRLRLHDPLRQRASSRLRASARSAMGRISRRASTGPMSSRTCSAAR